MPRHETESIEALYAKDAAALAAIEAPLTEFEARALAAEINAGARGVASKLSEFQRRRGWEALNYQTWGDCAKAEFGVSANWAERLLLAGKVRETVYEATGIVHEETPIPLSVAAELGALKDDALRLEAWLLAQAAVPETRRTGLPTAPEVRAAKKRVKAAHKPAPKPKTGRRGAGHARGQAAAQAIYEDEQYKEEMRQREERARNAERAVAALSPILRIIDEEYQLRKMLPEIASSNWALLYPPRAPLADELRRVAEQLTRYAESLDDLGTLRFRVVS
jgi:hypothetical protein